MRRTVSIILIIFSLVVFARIAYLNSGFLADQKKEPNHPKIVSPALYSRSAKAEKLADSIVNFAEEYVGTPYYYTGKCKATGFDCSGFTSFVYGHFGIDVSPASKDQIYAGKKIPLGEASRADLLIFTGTNAEIRQPGHVGIVISGKGEPVRFIHSSSGSAHGVTITDLSYSNYAHRLLQVRRVVE